LGGSARDESYDEERFRYQSTLAAIERAGLLVVIGTSGAPSLTARMCERAAARAIPFLVIDPEPTPFAALAQRSTRGAFVAGTASALVPQVVSGLGEALGADRGLG
jgi:NAD-dependent deacetylase